MISQKRSCSSAVIGAKSARACDSCLLKRARWYCAADDAFLCQGCDSSVHSANQLASRHERVRLNASSSSMITQGIVLAKEEDQAPAWHRGFTRKARTPRNPAGKSCLIMVEKKDVQREKLSNKFSPLIVPEMGSDESPFEETEEHLLCRVPVFDPFDTEFCNESNEREKGIGNEIKELFDDSCPELDGFQGFLPSDMELAEFAADVESLLGRQGNEDYKVRPETLSCFEAVKMEEEEEEIEAILACQFDPVTDMAREALDWQFKYNSPIPSEEDLKGEENTMMTKNSNSSNRVNMERTKMLTLNYEGVITAWASHGCPWTNGRRPQFDPDASLSDFMGISLANINQQYGDRLGGLAAGSTGGNEREARVSRYREKRRTRLFSKKIRYEVRKLNAEKRPRMKGRFVKRSSFAETTFS